MLSVVADFEMPANPPSGFVASLGSGIQAVASGGSAVSSGSAAAMSYNTLLNGDQEAQIDFVFTTRQECAIYGGLQTANDFTDNHYRVETDTIDSNYHSLKIVKRYLSVETTLAEKILIRGKYTTADTLRMRKIDAGTTTIIQGWVSGIPIVQYVDRINPLQGSSYVGVWIGASSSGMGIDNFRAGNLSVYWVANANKTSPTQSIGVDDTATNISGSGLNRGSFTYPFQTIKYGGHKSRLIDTGAVLMVRGGNYPERLNDSFSDILWKAGSSWHNPTTYQGFPGETVTVTYAGPAQAISVKGTSNGVGGTNYVQFIDLHQNGQGTGGGGFATGFKNSYIRFIWCTAKGNTGNPFTFGQYQGQNDYLNHHIELMESVGSGASEGSGTHGVYDQVSGTLIEHSEFHSNFPNPTGTGAYGIQHNVFAIPENGTVNTYDVVYRFNRLHGNGGGMVVVGTIDCLIYGNLVYRNNNQGGINVSGNAGFGKVACTNTIVANNTCYHNNTNIGQGYSIRVSSSVVNVWVVNNILYKPPVYTYSGINNESGGGTVEDNLNGTKGHSVGSEVDPDFADETAGSEDFRISSTSPARASVGGPFTDMSSYFSYDITGYPISDWDLGAYQYVVAGANEVAPSLFYNSNLSLIVDTEGNLALGVIDNNSPQLLQRVYLRVGAGATISGFTDSGGATVG